MKSIRLISLFLVVLMLGCALIACDTENYEDIELPERPFYDMTVSFQIKDDTGRTIIDAVNYNYKGHEDPTLLNVISDYVVIEADYAFKIDSKNNTLTQIGGFKANLSKGEYWAFMSGTGHDVQAILANPELQNKYFINGKMSEYEVKDGDSFTIVLVKG